MVRGEANREAVKFAYDWHSIAHADQSGFAAGR